MKFRILAVLLLWLAHAPALADSYESVLRFVRDGAVVKELPLEALREGCTAEKVAVDDPYYQRPKIFVGCRLTDVLALGFGRVPSADSRENFFLRARDGYTKPASGGRLAEPGGFVAFADAEHAVGDDPGWQPIDRRQVDPGPFYLVWSGDGQNDIHRYPWPYQLATIEIAPFESEYPNTLPAGVPDASPARTGFAIFRSECIACHAINGEGGVVGPELNVPRSIVEYRPAEQIKAFVRDPETFRYTSMPPHRHLTDADLDGLIAYFHAMKDRKRDPRQPASSSSVR
jgi:mono/diheme cytochrome c family protein